MFYIKFKNTNEQLFKLCFLFLNMNYRLQHRLLKFLKDQQNEQEYLKKLRQTSLQAISTPEFTIKLYDSQFVITIKQFKYSII